MCRLLIKITMIKLASVILFAIFLNHPTAVQHSTIIKQDKVHICDSRTAYAYHKLKSCRGLRNCTHTIKEITEYEAKNTYKRKKCKLCY